MATVTLRLPDNIVHQIDANAYNLHLSRSEYIKKAVLAMNKEIQEQALTQRLITASQMVRQESMLINAEFEAIENEPKN